MKLHIVCLTKSYDIVDFTYWYRYYGSFGNTVIHVIDNESPVDIRPAVVGTYERLEGWPDQWRLFDDIMNGNRYGFADGDYVLFADDDEYFWFRDGWEKELSDEFNRTELDVLCVPQIYMGSQNLKKSRTEPYVLCNYYRRNDLSSQGKCIIRYNSNVEYSFSRKDRETGHIPFLRPRGEKKWFRMSKVVGSDITGTTYGLTAHDAGIRLYHYHLKSVDDWEKKWERGSAACREHPYRPDYRSNPGYGGYTAADFTMRNYITGMDNKKDA